MKNDKVIRLPNYGKLIIVTDIISPILLWILITIEEGASMPQVILYPLGYIITLISSLIYNEIIILNFCGLNKNTKKFVEQWQRIESIELTIYRNDIKEGNLTNTDDE